MVDQGPVMNDVAVPLRAAAYICTGDDERVKDMSLETRREAIRSRCKREGWELVGMYEDNATMKERPALEQLVADARFGSFEVVVTHSADWLSPWNMAVQYTLRMVMKLHRVGIKFHSLGEGESTLDDDGRLGMRIEDLAWMMPYYDAMSDCIRKGISARRSQGVHWGVLPFGYRRCDASCPTDCADHYYCHPDPDQAAYVRGAFTRYDSGRNSMTEIASWLLEHGIRTKRGSAFTSRSVRSMLANPFYAGFIKDPGANSGVRPGIHRAIIDEELYRRVQAILRSNCTRQAASSGKGGS